MIVKDNQQLAIIGAGPAGLAAAYEAINSGFETRTFEKSAMVGGIARTELYHGYRFDIGGHRFFTKVPEIDRLWDEMLGERFIRVPRLSRIYYQDRFFKYPIEPMDTLVNLGLKESVLIASSYLKSWLKPFPVETNFEQWVSNRFGKRLYRMFFKTYTEKVWGIPCDQIQAEWAAQRIRGLSFSSVASNALFKRNNAKSLINEFKYPKLGPGLMWQMFQEYLTARNAPVSFNSEVRTLYWKGNRLTEMGVLRDGNEIRFSPRWVISSMPISELILALEPAPPEVVLQAARGLSYRDFVLVGLVVDRPHLFPDNWIYVHSPSVRVGRIQNFKNWSAALVPDPMTSSLGMEYFCNVGDETWTMSDDALIDRATRELNRLGLAKGAQVLDGVVIRQPMTYPVYHPRYRSQVHTIRQFLETLDNLQTIGRNGMYRYNNMDHSMLTGLLAVRNLTGERNDLWEINTEKDYHEEING